MRIKGFLDPDPDALRDFDSFATVIGGDDYQPAEGDEFVIAIGDPALRHRLVQALTEKGARFATLIHPLAYVARTATIGAGSVVSPFCHVAERAVLGAHVLLNTYASVGHDSHVGDGSVFSPYAAVNGNVRTGPRVFLGTHAVVTPGVAVGEDAKVGAGSVVYRAVPPRHLAMGNPAKAHPIYG